jgi:hypothetical protein
MIDLLREIRKPVLKLDFTAHGIIESLSEFGHSVQYHCSFMAGAAFGKISGTQATFSVTGSYLKAKTSFLKRVTRRILQ